MCFWYYWSSAYMWGTYFEFHWFPALPESLFLVLVVLQGVLHPVEGDAEHLALSGPAGGEAGVSQEAAEPSRVARSGQSRSARLSVSALAPLHFFPPSQRDCWHKTPLKSGGQLQRWFWTHVPPFWHKSNSSSHTFTVEKKLCTSYVMFKQIHTAFLRLVWSNY